MLDSTFGDTGIVVPDVLVAEPGGGTHRSVLWRIRVAGDTTHMPVSNLIGHLKIGWSTRIVGAVDCAEKAASVKVLQIFGGMRP